MIHESGPLRVIAVHVRSRRLRRFPHTDSAVLKPFPLIRAIPEILNPAVLSADGAV